MQLLKSIRILRPYQFCKNVRATEEPPYLELQRDFIDPAEFYGILKKAGIDFYTGVPDSLLKDFCAYVTVPI
jgi:phosphonopyruvate decarboxylase